MNQTYTTHLMCAPELQSPATVSGIHVQSGECVETDALLIQLQIAETFLDICAPESGIVGEILVAAHESVSSHDLLLTMEIEEQEFGFLPLPEVEQTLPPACLIPTKLPKTAPHPENHPLRILPESARMAARFGVNLAEVKPGPDGVVDDEAITLYIRDILTRWSKLQRLLND